MVARICCLALALGILVGCYNLPQPECGFACGPAGACPSDYSCNMAVNRCELSGTTPSCDPAPRSDAGTDDVQPDTPEDFTPPMVTWMSPPDLTEDVSLDVLVQAQFNEPVGGWSGSTFRVSHLGQDEVGPVMYDPSTFTVSRNLSGLLPDTQYTVTVSGITDFAGNAAFASWTFRTIDTRAPTVAPFSPTDGETGVGVGRTIIAEFSEPVTGVSAASFTVTQGGMPVAGTVTYTETFGVRAELDPSTQLLANTLYTVNLTSAIRDRATIPNALAPATWSFTTGPDLQAPAVVTRTPLPASAAVPVTAQVTASFDEPVINVSTTSFTLTPQGGSPIAATVSYAAGTRTATLIPDLQLAPNTLHTAVLTSPLSDAAGNPLTPAPVGWMFTTAADTIGPRVALTTPANLATAVPTSSTIAVRFDEPVQNVSTTTFTLDSGAITGTIAMSAGNTIATFTPDVALPASATISVDLTIAITDASTNALAAPVAFSFMTAP